MAEKEGNNNSNNDLRRCFDKLSGSQRGNLETKESD